MAAIPVRDECSSTATLTRGEVWSRIRARLSAVRADLRAAVADADYEIESARLDRIARLLADAVLRE